jgi:hypothetical protein
MKSNFSLSGILKNTMGGVGNNSSSMVMNILNIALPFILKKFKK